MDDDSPVRDAAVGVCGLCRHPADDHGAKGCGRCACRVTFGEHRSTAASLMARLKTATATIQTLSSGAASGRKRRSREAKRPLRRTPRPGVWAYRGLLLQYDSNGRGWYSWGADTGESVRPIDPGEGAASRADLVATIDAAYDGMAAQGRPMSEPPDFRDDPRHYGFAGDEWVGFPTDSDPTAR